ncbi:hypothetical protein G2583_pO550052 (plasmid) [Escherichia coli O55:H7 str. CB9615]|nr:hypothetical protein G2583_pO550052 [Escherichia coli O55:H7 str. CB9615]
MPNNVNTKFSSVCSSVTAVSDTLTWDKSDADVAGVSQKWRITETS